MNAREKREKRRLEDWRWVLSQPQGRRVLHEIVAAGRPLDGAAGLAGELGGARLGALLLAQQVFAAARAASPDRRTWDEVLYGEEDATRSRNDDEPERADGADGPSEE